MNYSESLAFLDRLPSFETIPETRYSLDKMTLMGIQQLLESLGNPERKVPLIHVAGTKGKGSTSAMIASILEAGGRTCGLYSSPHLVDIRERLSIGGVFISPAEFSDILTRMQPVISEMGTQPPTSFEVMTAMAFQYFSEKSVDIAVIETGLGGRTDATNVITPLVAVLTSISLDHTAILGSTLREIAREKGGIIKSQGTAVVAPQEPEVVEVLDKIAQDRATRLIQVGREITFQREKEDISGQKFSCSARVGLGRGDISESFFLPLLGQHQLENAATAIGAILALNASDSLTDLEAIRKGLAGVRIPGRLHIISNHPFLVVDGAHNPYSAKLLRQSIQSLFPGRKVVLILGTSSDKDIPGIIAELAPLAKTMILTKSRHPRAATLDALEKAAGTCGPPIVRAEHLEEALVVGKNMLDPEGVLLATGSLFLVGEVLTLEKMETRTR